MMRVIRPSFYLWSVCFFSPGVRGGMDGVIKRSNTRVRLGDVRLGVAVPYTMKGRYRKRDVCDTG